MYNSVPGRMDYEVALQVFSEAFAGMGYTPDIVKRKFRPTLSRLRLEQPCTTTTTQINFPVLINQGNPFNTEVRLNLQDSFFPTHIGILFGNPSSATDAAYTLYSYLNPFIFNPAMNAYYNGTMRMLVNNVQYINNWPVVWHKHAPETQQTAAAGAGSPIDQYDGAIDGKVAQQPSVLMIGSQNIQLSINLPAAPTAVTANSRIIIMVDGLLFQNSTVVS